MRLRDIESFLAIIEASSFAKAAERLFITQPTLSHRIQTLESELGFPLFVRKRGERQVELTDEGRRFVRIAETHIRLLAESKALSAQPFFPSFRIAATQTLSAYILPTVYEKFVARNLPVFIELQTLHYEECFKAIENRSTDVAFVSRVLASSKVSSHLITSEKMVLLCNQSAPFDGPVHPSELDKRKEIYMAQHHEYIMWHDYWFGPSEYAISADNMQLIERIVSHSDYWAIVPLSAACVLAERESGVKYLPLAASPPERSIYLLTMGPQGEYTHLIADDFRSAMDAIKETAFAGDFDL